MSFAGMRIEAKNLGDRLAMIWAKTKKIAWRRLVEDWAKAVRRKTFLRVPEVGEDADKFAR